MKINVIPHLNRVKEEHGTIFSLEAEKHFMPSDMQGIRIKSYFPFLFQSSFKSANHSFVRLVDILGMQVGQFILTNPH